LASRCKTQNEFNRLCITLENVLTPAEISAIAELDLPAETAERAQQWLGRLRIWQPELPGAPQHYLRYPLSSRLIVYRDPRRESSNKDLLIAFTGVSGRLMMPVCVFLQFIDSNAWDVALLKKPLSGSHFHGVETNVDDFPGVVQFVETALQPRQYKRVMTLGASAGGFPALWAAALLGAVRGISAGGGPPRTVPDLGWTKLGRQSVDFRMVYAAELVPDHERALALQNLFGGQLHPVPNVATHGVLGELLKRGLLDEFLNEILA
jgi:hypothetical protein